jgi:hypothetical protein
MSMEAILGVDLYRPAEQVNNKTRGPFLVTTLTSPPTQSTFQVAGIEIGNPQTLHLKFLRTKRIEAEFHRK